MKNLENSLFSLFKFSNNLQQLNKDIERDLGLSLVQWCVLRRLVDRPAISAQQLAKIVGVHPSTLTQTLARLKKKGFIFVGSDPLDARKKVVSITRLGKQQMDSAAVSLAGRHLQKLTKLTQTEIPIVLNRDIMVIR